MTSAARRHAALLALVAGLGLYAGSWHAGGHAGPALPALARSVSRPVLLPFLWSGIERARREGRMPELFERGRLLLGLLPCWVDGHVYFADRLVFAIDPQRGDAQHGLDALATALVLLEESSHECPRKADEILVVMAFLVEQRCRQWPALAAAFRARFGEDPRQRAAAYLERAERLRGSAALRERRAYLAVRMIAPALESGRRDRVAARIAEALRLLDTVRDQQTAEHYKRALRRLRRYVFDRDPGVTFEELARDPWLQDLVEALPRRR